MTRRRRIAVGLAIAGGAGLVAALFAPWYTVGAIVGTDVAGHEGLSAADLRAPAVSGWTAFGLVDVWLAVAGLAAAASGLARLSGRVPAVLRRAAFVACAVGLVLVVVRIANAPSLTVESLGDGVFFGSLDGFGLVTRAWGVWVALVAAVAALAGTLLLVDGDG